MKKLFAVAVLAVALLGFAAPAAYSDTQAQVIRIAQDQTAPQPSAADVAAYDAFQQWAADHMLEGVGRFHASEDGKTITGFDLALFAEGDTDPKWVVYNYPTVAQAAAQIEADFAQYPDGHQSVYIAPEK